MRLVALASIVALSLPLASARAEDPATHTIDFVTERYAVGDVNTHAMEETNAQKVVVNVGEQTVQDKQETSKESSRVVERVESVDDAGQSTRSTLFVKAWRIESGEKVDTSLEGALVEVTGKKGARSWKILHAPGTPSDRAKAWLDEEWGKGKKGDNTMGKAMTPSKPVAVGESWEPDIEIVAKELGEKFTVDTSKSKARLTLDKVENGVQHVSVAFELHTTGVQSPQGEMTWKEGGLLSFTGKMSKSATANTPKRAAMDFGIVGTAESGPAVVKLDIQVKKVGELTAGGEIPALPVK
jgi:hypothetical protein